MIRKYCLRDCGPDNEDISFDLKDEALARFLHESLRYCSLFSLDIHQRYSGDPLGPLSEFETAMDGRDIRPADDDITMRLPVQEFYTRHYYLFCERSLQCLLGVLPGLFDFCSWSAFNMPENLTLYRKDRSIFFMSETHEGDAYLSVTAAAGANPFISPMGRPFGQKNRPRLTACRHFYTIKKQPVSCGKAVLLIQ